MALFSPKLLPALLAVALVLAGQPASAQFDFKANPGTVELRDGTTHQATMDYQLANFWRPGCLTYKNDQGKTSTVSLGQIQRFVIGQRLFIPVDRSLLPEVGGYDRKYQDPIFLEVIDTGRVELYAYYYFYQLGANYSTTVAMLALRPRGNAPLVFFHPDAAPGISRKAGTAQQVASLFAEDPELQKRLLSGSVPDGVLVQYVRAYNNGERLPIGMDRY